MTPLVFPQAHWGLPAPASRERRTLALKMKDRCIDAVRSEDVPSREFIRGLNSITHPMPAFRCFAQVNLIIVSVAVVSHLCSTYLAWFISSGTSAAVISLWSCAVIRCSLFVHIVSVLTRHSPKIDGRRITVDRKDVTDNLVQIFTHVAPLEAFVFSVAKHLSPGLNEWSKTRSDFPTSPTIPTHFSTHSLDSSASLFDLLGRVFVFIMNSFLFELIFDFFHYWAHRTCHASPWLYRNVHKTHHRHSKPSPFTTFEHHPADLILSNVFPCVASFLLLSQLGVHFSTTSELEILFAYKTYIEVAGHAGVDTNTRSFPQFVWLPDFIQVTQLHSMSWVYLNLCIL